MRVPLTWDKLGVKFDAMSEALILTKMPYNGNNVLTRA